jgi:hypothetical protein
LVAFTASTFVYPVVVHGEHGQGGHAGGHLGGGSGPSPASGRPKVKAKGTITTCRRTGQPFASIRNSGDYSAVDRAVLVPLFPDSSVPASQL